MSCMLKQFPFVIPSAARARNAPRLKELKVSPPFATGGAPWLAISELRGDRSIYSIFKLLHLTVAPTGWLLCSQTPHPNAPLQCRHIFNSWKHLLCAAEHHSKQRRRRSDAGENKRSPSDPVSKTFETLWLTAMKTMTNEKVSAKQAWTPTLKPSVAKTKCTRSAKK